MYKLFLYQIFLQRSFCNYKKIKYGKANLPEKFTSTNFGSFLEKKFWYKAKNQAILVAFKPGTPERNILVLVLKLPFSKEELAKNTILVGEEKTEYTLRKHLQLKTSVLFQKLMFIELDTRANQYFCFSGFNNCRFAVLSFNNTPKSKKVGHLKKIQEKISLNIKKRKTKVCCVQEGVV